MSKQQKGQCPGLIVWDLGGREIVGWTQPDVETHVLVISVQLVLGKPEEVEAPQGPLT